MNLFKLLNVFLLCCAMCMVSCSDGADGKDGIDGINGTDGADGADGNANVTTLDFDISTASGNQISQNIGLADTEFDNYAYFVFLKRTLNTSTWYGVPGPIFGNVAYSRHFLITDLDPGFVTLGINFYRTSDDSDYLLVEGAFETLRVVAINLGLSNKGDKQNLLNELKSAGVDTNDYDSVAAYFGLE